MVIAIKGQPPRLGKRKSNGVRRTRVGELSWERSHRLGVVPGATAAGSQRAIMVLS
jgi:hypothetical protein